MSERDEIVYGVLLALRSLSDAMDRMHGAVGGEMEMNLTDLRALRVLIKREQREESVSPHELARHLRISTASTSKLLDRLEVAGHVERLPHPHDRRARVVVLTDHSRHSFFTHFGAHLQTMRGVADQYDDADLAVVSGFLDRMAIALDPE